MGWRGLPIHLWNMWLVRGFKIGFSKRIQWTGYTKRKPMKFKRPVPEEFGISAEYGKWGPYWTWHQDFSGLWVHEQSNGKGQHKGIDFAVPEGTMVLAMA